MKDVMLDFETFGNGPDACIVQAGACYFDRETGEIGKTFKENIEAGDPLNGKIDASTIYWWLAQSPEAIWSITGGVRSLSIAATMNRLNAFVMHADQIWSHATFDFVIFQETLKRLAITPTFSFRAARDIRTLLDLADMRPPKTAARGVAHDALDDCKFQVSYCVEALKKLKGKNEQPR